MAYTLEAFVMRLVAAGEAIKESSSALAVPLTHIVFIEAEFFGGLGSQAAIGWQAGQLAFGPLQGKDAINQVLHWLGIIPAGQADEFEALRLGRYRSTEDRTKT
jgi:hypothetical protein